MKKLQLAFLVMIFFSLRLLSQSSVTSSVTNNAKCFGICDGVVSFTIANAIPPYTITTTNSNSGCSVPAPFTSTSNTFTLGNLCPCSSGLYTFSVTNSSNTLIGYSNEQFQISATASLNVSVGSIVATSCPTCCTGTADMIASGGSTSAGPVVFYLDGTYLAWQFYPAINICAGTHTVCGHDNYGCVKCTTFVMPSGSVGINELNTNLKLDIFPNPCQGDFSISKTINDITELTISSIIGTELKKFIFNDLNKDIYNFSISDLNKGIYIVSQKTLDGKLIGRSTIVLN